MMVNTLIFVINFSEDNKYPSMECVECGSDH